MGKRKSKTSKQKQAKAAAKSLKAKVVRKEQVHVATDDGSGNKANAKNKKRVMNGEYADFQRQQASMQERHMAETRRLKSNKKRGKKNISSFAFHAATLVVDDAQKSTNQLMGEVANKVQGWDGLHEQQQPQNITYSNSALPSTTNHQPISLKQVYQNTQVQQQQQQFIQQKQKQKKKNQFALLQNDDDDSDNEETGNGQLNGSKPLFQFAPPSFAIPSFGGGASVDDDPDL